jgi:steroid 5-alpha reductase family enzyme
MMNISTLNIMTLLWIAIAIVTFLVLIITHIRAPYGRHANAKWGEMIDNKWGWFWMELPAFLIFPLLIIFGPREKDLVSWLLVGLWSLHYFHRTFFFPFRLKTKGKKMPLMIVGSALLFNAINGYLNGYYLGFIAPQDGDISNWNVYVGAAIFCTGFIVNQIADHKLIGLRNSFTGYKIPRGWFFEYISCPNHFGEILEWFGFAIIAWSLPALSFAIWTFCNLVPRALNHHTWYHEHFDDYPVKRKAVFPNII